MPIHAAIIRPEYLTPLLGGAKTIEARLSRVRCEPFARIAPGERIYFKVSSGRFAATGVVRAVESFEDLTPDAVARLCEQFNDRILGEDAYWQAKRQARYATLITLGDVEPITFGPPMTGNGNGRAWFILPDDLDVYPACLGDPGRSTSG